jgi:hypothetical protein
MQFCGAAQRSAPGANVMRVEASIPCEDQWLFRAQVDNRVAAGRFVGLIDGA